MIHTGLWDDMLNRIYIADTIAKYNDELEYVLIVANDLELIIASEDTEGLTMLALAVVW